MENEAKQLITCRFSEFLIQLCKKKRFLGGSCRDITFFGVCEEILLFWGFVQKYYCPELLHLQSLVQGPF